MTQKSSEFTLLFFVLCAGFGGALAVENCSVHYQNSEYLYEDFFVVESPYKESNTTLRFEFFVKSECDAHFLFTTSSPVGANDTVYEIVLGGGKTCNTASEIRKGIGMEPVARNVMDNLLAGNETRPFWIGITTDGFVQIGRGGHVLPFMSWKNEEPFEIKQFSLAGGRAPAEFDFRCDPSNIVENPPPEPEEI